MGTAWASARSYPWEQGLYVGGIETAKVNLALRIYSNAWHVYAGLAILNPSARIQIDQYASSATELFKLMIRGGSGEEEERKVFRERVLWAKSVVFGDGGGGGGEDGTGKGKKKGRRKPILLSADVLDRFSLAKMPPPPPPPRMATTHHCYRHLGPYRRLPDTDPTRTCRYWRWWIVGRT
jgi:prephenate dehydrogenase (NADP+)